MTAFLIEILALVTLVAGVLGALVWARGHYPTTPDPVIDAIDALLPQTQCAQCGYPGCRPYAQAIAAGAPLDLCPPGGRDVQLALATLLGRPAGEPLETASAIKVRIDESRCIGCFLCVEACPVDAIVGAPQFLHTVLEERCTGCELCLSPCPVDCIDVVAADTHRRDPLPQSSMSCIRCGRCEPVCPEALPVERLWWLSRGDDLTEALANGLDRCIECGLCNPECPSELDLAGTFRAARQHLRANERAHAAATLAGQQVNEHNDRLARAALRARDRRNNRLDALKSRRNP